jgi:mRNA interferase MazF
MVLKKNNIPLQGEIWLFDPDPVKGSEIGKHIRPSIIISCNSYNKGLSGLVIVVPLTSKEKHIPLRVRIESSNGNDGLDKVSFGICDQLRAISTDRLIKKIGSVDKDILVQIQSWINDLLWIE